MIFQHGSCAVITQKDFAITFLDENIGFCCFFFTKRRGSKSQIGKPETKTSASLCRPRPVVWWWAGPATGEEEKER